MEEIQTTCPKCGAPLKQPEETKTGKKLQRCSTGSWNSETRQTEGCDYVKWLTEEPKTLDEACPKCGAPLVLQVTRSGKKMKKCSTGGWDKEQRVATGCDYVQWLNGDTKPLDEDCPMCGEKLVLFTTSSGKKMKKCSTAGWDREFRQPTGCTFVQWLKDGE
jgi:ssDNA-binding Zn-finger/Zn-ribbon topoisomerase 1